MMQSQPHDINTTALLGPNSATRIENDRSTDLRAGALCVNSSDRFDGLVIPSSILSNG